MTSFRRRLSALFSRACEPFRKQRRDGELADELASHLQSHVDDNVRAGMTPEAARRDARLKLGGMDQTKERYRDRRGLTIVDAAMQDIRYVCRGLRKNPGFTAVAVLTLALGVGANTAIYGVVYSVLLKPLPYTHPEQLVTLSTSIPGTRFPSLPVRAIDFQEIRRSNGAFAEMSAIAPADFNLTGAGEPERLHGVRVSANLFSMLGAQPERGRTFLPEEDADGRDHVAIISHELWVRRFGSDRDVLNRTLSLNGQSYVVVGIMPRGFLFPTGAQLHPLVPLGPRVDVWKPMAFTRSELTSEGSWNWGVIGRLKSGTSMRVAQENVDTIATAIVKRVLTQIPNSGFDVRVQLQPIREMFSGNVRQPLLVLTGAGGLLLLIACVNLANLLLARVSGRQRELATRKALGASRSRLFRQLLTESLVIASLGGAAGLLLAPATTRLLLSLGPSDLARVEPEISVPIIVFALLTTALTAVAFGLAPAFEAGRAGFQERLKVGGARTGSLRRFLVAAEVALCTVLLAVSALLLRSFVNVNNVDKGFAVEKILSVDLTLSGRRYSESRTVTFYQTVLERIRALPGVRSAGAANALPLTRESDTTQVYFEADARYRLLERPVAMYRNITPGFLTTMEIPLLAGRLLEGTETPPAVIISARLAKALWPDEAFSQALGRRVRQGDITSALLTVVGVVGDVRTGALDREPMPVIYRPHTQSASRDMTVVIRTSGEPEALALAVRTTVGNIDMDVPIPTMRTMREIVSASTAPRRFQMVLITVFGAVALVLAVVGVYGVTSHAVASRTKEVGIRMALGAQRASVVWSVLIQGLQPVLVGLAIGLVGGRVAAISIQSALFGIGPLDPIALVGVVCALFSTAALACGIPARRASSVDPVIALRAE